MNILKNKLLWVVSFLVLLSLVFFFRSGKKELHLSTAHEVLNFDTATAFSDDTLRILGQIYEPLYQYHYLLRPFQVIPLLAEELPLISPDSLTYTIKIKKNISYHDHRFFMGKPRYVEAKDFVLAIKRLAFAPFKSPAQGFFNDKILGFNEFKEKVGDDFEKLLSLEMEGVSAPDDHTLVIRLQKPVITMTALLTTLFLSPVPEEILRATKNDLSKEDIGTGPFRLSSYDAKRGLILERFKPYREDFYPSIGDHYANEKELLRSMGKRLPFLDRVVVSFIKDDNERWEKFLKGELDLIEVPKSKMGELNGTDSELNEKFIKKGWRFESFPVYSNKWLSFNMRDPLVGKNADLRRAIAHALDIPNYIQEKANNSLQEANSILTPGIMGYDPKRKPSFSYNLALAKEYLRKAGFPEGKGLAPLTFSTRTESLASKTMAEFVKASLDKLGIQIKIQYLPLEELLQRGRSGALQFWADSWFYDYPEAENILQLLVTKNFPGINKSAYSNKEVDKLYEKITTKDDSAEALRSIEMIEDMVYRDLPWIVYGYERTTFLFKEDLENFRYTGFIRADMKYLDL